MRSQSGPLFWWVESRHTASLSLAGLQGERAKVCIEMSEVCCCPNPACGRPSKLGLDPLGRTFRCSHCGTKLAAIRMAPFVESSDLLADRELTPHDLDRPILGAATPLMPQAPVDPVIHAQSRESEVADRADAFEPAAPTAGARRRPSWRHAATAAAVLGTVALAGSMLLDLAHAALATANPPRGRCSISQRAEGPAPAENRRHGRRRGALKTPVCAPLSSPLARLRRISQIVVDFRSWRV